MLANYYALPLLTGRSLLWPLMSEWRVGLGCERPDVQPHLHAHAVPAVSRALLLQL